MPGMLSGMQTPSTFALASSWLLHIEGGYASDPDDPGGETRYGISRRAYPQLDLVLLTPVAARDIYRNDFWNKARCDKLPPALAWVTFDACVQHGVKVGVMQLQQVLGVRADGINGPTTQRAAARVELRETLVELFAQRLGHYSDLITADGRRVKYRSGWHSRVIRLARAIYGRGLHRG